MAGDEIALPIAMMHDTATTLDQSGTQLGDDISAAIALVSQFVDALPSHQADIERELEKNATAYYQQMLAARNLIARILREAAEAATRLDESAWNALTPDQ